MILNAFEYHLSAEVVYLQRCLVVTWLVSRETAAVSLQDFFQTDGTKKPKERSPKHFKLLFEIFKDFSLETRRVRDV